jgi:hypothetical protein
MPVFAVIVPSSRVGYDGENVEAVRVEVLILDRPLALTAAGSHKSWASCHSGNLALDEARKAKNMTRCAG